MDNLLLDAFTYRRGAIGHWERVGPHRDWTLALGSPVDKVRNRFLLYWLRVCSNENGVGASLAYFAQAQTGHYAYCMYTDREN